MTDQKRVRAGIYARISRDASQEGLGVERQEEDCRKMATQLGWEVLEVFIDNDISAHSGQYRPQYRKMLSAIEEGKIQAILAYHPDRLHRRNSELEEFVNFVERHGTQIQTVGQGHYDLSTPSGRFTARVVGAAAQHEVERTKERQTRAKQQMVQQGKYRGGPRPFGFEKDGITHRESEARVIRDATTAVLAGRSLAAVAKELNGQGHRTSFGKEWSYARLKDVLIRPRNAGLVARGTPGRKASSSNKRHAFEIISKAQWAPIVSEEEWNAVTAHLTAPSRRNPNHGNNPRWLGSGLYECGKCGGPLRPAPYGGKNKPKSERRHLYRCTSSAHLTISAEQTDDFVRRVVAELLKDNELAARMTPANPKISDDRAYRAALATRIQQFEDDYIAGAIPQRVYNKAVAKAEEELELIDARLAQALSASATSEIISSSKPSEAFWAAPVDVQKAVAKILVRVVIQPTPRRGVRWSPDRVKIISLIRAEHD